MLEAFLIFDVFVAGVLAALAFRYAYAHFHPARHVPEHLHHPAPQSTHLPTVMRQQLLAEAEKNFHAILSGSAADLQKDLATTSQAINNLLDKMGAEIVSTELENYRQKLAQLQAQAVNIVAAANTELAQQQAALKASAAADIEAEKQKLIELVNTRLAEAVVSFLLETLSHNVDLGAQGAYLTAMLEEHKAELIKELGSGA